MKLPFDEYKIMQQKEEAVWIRVPRRWMSRCIQKTAYDHYVYYIEGGEYKRDNIDPTASACKRAMLSYN